MKRGRVAYGRTVRIETCHGELGELAHGEIGRGELGEPAHGGSSPC